MSKDMEGPGAGVTGLPLSRYMSMDEYKRLITVESSAFLEKRQSIRLYQRKF